MALAGRNQDHALGQQAFELTDVHEHHAFSVGRNAQRFSGGVEYRFMVDPPHAPEGVFYVEGVTGYSNNAFKHGRFVVFADLKHHKIAGDWRVALIIIV